MIITATSQDNKVAALLATNGIMILTVAKFLPNVLIILYASSALPPGDS